METLFTGAKSAMKRLNMSISASDLKEVKETPSQRIRAKTQMRKSPVSLKIYSRSIITLITRT
jgi:hypothetical protein